MLGYAIANPIYIGLFDLLKIRNLNRLQYKCVLQASFVLSHRPYTALNRWTTGKTKAYTRLLKLHADLLISLALIHKLYTGL